MTSITRSALSLVAVASLGLAACSVGTEAKPADARSSAATNTQAAEINVEASGNATVSQETTASASASQADSSQSSIQKWLQFEVPAEVNQGTCTDGIGTVSQTPRPVSFTGHCDVIKIEAPGAAVFAESVGKVVVTEPMVQIYAESISEVEIGTGGNGVVSRSGIDTVTIGNARNSIIADGDIGKAVVSGDGNSVLSTGEIKDVQDNGVMNQIRGNVS